MFACSLRVRRGRSRRRAAGRRDAGRSRRKGATRRIRSRRRSTGANSSRLAILPMVSSSGLTETMTPRGLEIVFAVDRAGVSRRRTPSSAPMLQTQVRLPSSTENGQSRSLSARVIALHRTSSARERAATALAASTSRCEGTAVDHQCATAAAAASSISRPVRKRSSVNGALIGCGLSLAMVWAKTWPEPGVALKPPVPQPQLT